MSLNKPTGKWMVENIRPSCLFRFVHIILHDLGTVLVLKYPRNETGVIHCGKVNSSGNFLSGNEQEISPRTSPFNFTVDGSMNLLCSLRTRKW